MVETLEMQRALTEGWTPMSARCRVCGVYAVRVQGKLMMYCIVGCPCDDPGVQSDLVKLGMNTEELDKHVEAWVDMWKRDGRRVP